MYPQRHITTQENNSLKLLQYFEKLVDEKKLYGALVIKHDAVSLMIKRRIANPLRIISTKTDDCSEVRFELHELYKYIMFVAKLAGLTVHIDGSVTTRDGMTLENNDLN